MSPIVLKSWSKTDSAEVAFLGGGVWAASGFLAASCLFRWKWLSCKWPSASGLNLRNPYKLGTTCFAVSAHTPALLWKILGSLNSGWRSRVSFFFHLADEKSPKFIWILKFKGILYLGYPKKKSHLCVLSDKISQKISRILAISYCFWSHLILWRMELEVERRGFSSGAK